MRKTISRLSASLLGLFYDNKCPACGHSADSIAAFPICSACMAGVSGYQGPCCNMCARPFASRYSMTCGDCLSDPPPFERAMSFSLYEGTLMEAIHLMKFKGARQIARQLSGMLSGLDLPPGADAIVPVPMTRAGLIKRGFNQSALVAAEQSRSRGIPLRLDLLYKVKETPPQLGLTKKARQKNLRGAFRADHAVKGMHVIVLDDVITTGATMRECARALKKAGASEVTALSIARTY